VAIYTRRARSPWDDAVTLALTYAGIPFEKVWDDEVLAGKLAEYEWVHLFHEDFTGPAEQALPRLQRRAVVRRAAAARARGGAAHALRRCRR
jgi:hypothetical protein